MEQLRKRLDDCFRLLVAGSGTAPSRQRTLEATLDWSHQLLAEPEQVAFRRLAVCARAAGVWRRQLSSRADLLGNGSAPASASSTA